jgi:hypothetical protein
MTGGAKNSTILEVVVELSSEHVNGLIMLKTVGVSLCDF